MKILMAGASSFTGYWFAKTLAARGHQLTLTFTKSRTEYTGLRGQRVTELVKLPGAFENRNDQTTVVAPGGYTGSQKEFTLNFAKEIGTRLNIMDEVKFDVQENFDEPLARINTSPAII